jgi:DNA-binding MarR family transcriptional regulator
MSETGLGIDRCNCAALRRASRRITQFYDGKLAATGLRITQYAILSLLARRGELAVNELAAHMELDRTTTGKNLRPLERSGLLKIAPSATDRRSRKVKLTPKGTATFKAALPRWQEAQREFETANGREAAETMRTMLAQIATGPAA